MDKLTAIKIKYNDGTYSDKIPVTVLVENVEWDDSHTLIDVLGSVDINVTGTIQYQIDKLFNEKINYTQLNNYVANQLNTDVTVWLENNVNPVGSTVIVDKSLSIEGAAADAKKTGDEIASLKEDLSDNANPYIGSYKVHNGTISSSGKWSIRSDRHYIIVPVKPNTKFSIESGSGRVIAFLTAYTDNPENGSIPSFCVGHEQHYSSLTYWEGILPADCHYFFVNLNGSNYTDLPSTLIIDGYDYAKTILNNIKNLNDNVNGLSLASNDPVNAVMTIAETYFNEAYNPDNSIIYKSEHGIFSEPFYEDKKAIVCSQFSQACIAGIAYENSRFAKGYDSYNDPYWWGFVSDGSGHYSWEFYEQEKEPGESTDPDDYGSEQQETSWHLYGRDYMSAQEQFDYFNSKGVAHSFDADHNDIKPGDLIFYLASTWNPALENTDEDYVSHVAICVRAFNNDTYSVIHANSNRKRKIDGAPTALLLQEWKYSTTKPSYYVHIKDISVFPCKTSSELIWYKDWNNKSGAVSGNTKVGEIITVSDFYPIERGFYTINTKISGDCNDVYVVQKIKNSSDTIINHSGVHAGESSIVIYVQTGISGIDLYVKNGTTYAVKETSIYKGYHSYDN